ncbi:S41 family peptidase [Pedobacter sp. N23S346]|uniref:S41 family peptidase n=1 Tax=Pedobacter sp. N23S346 TaxID=3402750 RepID=UPI003AC74C63
MKKRKFGVSCLFLLILMGASACKKEKSSSAETGEIISPTTGTRTQFTLDSIFLYAQQVYLWSDALPTYADFNPRQKYADISPDITAFKKELFDISQFKINKATGSAYEFPIYAGSAKYSYLETGRSNGGATAGVISSSPAVLASKGLTSSDKNIAYLALGAFPKLSSCQAILDQTFTELAVTNPKYIVVDLRSNTGGYVETAEYIANLMVPSSLNGKVMYMELFNAKMQAGQASILRHQPYLDASGKTVVYNGRNATMADVDYTENGNTYHFNKKGNLTTIQEVYFIVSGKTASASELLISCLKPYFNVKLIGEKTYGKPVGFFAINIDQYSVYLSSFLIRNAAGWSDYFAGMPADIAASSVANPELGNPEELCLKAAINDINGLKTTAKVGLGNTKLMQVNPSSAATIIETATGFGMQETRLKLKNK